MPYNHQTTTSDPRKAYSNLPIGSKNHMTFTFEEISHINISATDFVTRQLNMVSVNYELGPFLKMSCPKEWEQRPLTEWQTGTPLFRSVICAFWVLPIDLHTFYMEKVSAHGFEERSSSWMNSVWVHKRTVEPDGASCKIHDVVEFTPRVRMIGALAARIYQTVFKHRHKRLQVRFGAKLR